MTVQFLGATGALHYLFALRNMETDTIVPGYNRKQISDTLLTVSGLSLNTKYKWAVCAVDIGGNEYWCDPVYFIVNGNNCMILNVLDEAQETHMWCAAATSRTIMRYLGVSNLPSQSQIITDVHGTPDPDLGMNIAQVQNKIFNKYGVSSSFAGPYPTFDWQMVYDNIHGWYLMIFYGIQHIIFRVRWFGVKYHNIDEMFYYINLKGWKG